MKISKTFFGLTALAGALALGLVLLTDSTDAYECRSCGGPLQTASGSAPGDTCSQALAAAYNVAHNNAWAGAPACTPCQITTASQACALPSCVPPGPCPNYIGVVGLNYRCETCDPGGPYIP